MAATKKTSKVCIVCNKPYLGTGASKTCSKQCASVRHQSQLAEQKRQRLNGRECCPACGQPVPKWMSFRNDGPGYDAD